MEVVSKLFYDIHVTVWASFYLPNLSSGRLRCLACSISDALKILALLLSTRGHAEILAARIPHLIRQELLLRWRQLRLYKVAHRSLCILSLFIFVELKSLSLENLPWIQINLLFVPHHQILSIKEWILVPASLTFVDFELLELCLTKSFLFFFCTCFYLGDCFVDIYATIFLKFSEIYILALQFLDLV